MSEEMRRRLAAIRRRLRKIQLRRLVVTKPANVSYLTGFTGDDSWAVIGQRGVCLVMDSRYSEQAEKECVGCKIVERRGALSKATAKVLGTGRGAQAVGVEKSTSVRDFEGLKKSAKVKLRSVEGVIESIRSVKSKWEISAIRGAVRISGKALECCIRNLRAGMSENRVAGLLEFEIRKLGGQRSFETIVAFGAHGSRPHHRTGQRRLKANDRILIDFGVRYKGYCCDLTRCFAVGKVSDFYRKVYRAVEEAQAAAISRIRAGAEIAAVDGAAREVIRGYGLPAYGHGTGHGLGLEVHELPVVSRRAKGKLEAGQVVTVEPGVYIPGRCGVRIEDDVLVTEGGAVVLSGKCVRWREVSV